ncbi:MAG: DUF3160 domain-containing protein [Candidatus Hodarchaeota archaeon]
MIKRIIFWSSFLLLIVPILQAQSKSTESSYNIEKELKNVVNLDDFKEAIKYRTRKEFSFTDVQKERLIQNGFVVTPANAEQFFQVYESHPHFGIEKPRIPNFITTDSVLHLFHLFYDFTLRTVEIEKLLPLTMKLTQGLIEGAMQQYEEITEPNLKNACMKNISFFGVATRLLEMEEIALPQKCVTEVEQELEKIKTHRGKEVSTIFPFSHDYSQYNPRGHYTRSQELTRYFLAMMWYGTNSFPFKSENEQQVLQALLINQLLNNFKIEDKPLIDYWDKVYSITVLYVGPTDDLNPHHFKELMLEVYGREIPLDILSDSEKLNAIYEKTRELPMPKISQISVGIPSGRQFRLFGQRFIPDSYIMQNLVSWPERPWPKGLDVMAVLNSKRAAYILDYIDSEPKKWNGYKSKRTQLIKEFEALKEDDWYRNIYFGWLYVLKALLEEKEDNKQVGFMQNLAWTDKELNTALASWVELRHDVVLYVEPSGAEGGDGEKIPQPKGYVEPVPEFYRRLIKLIGMNKKILEGEKFLSGELKDLFNRFIDLISFLESVSEKELQGRALNYDEYERIRYFGGEIEGLSLSIIEIDRNLPVFDWETKQFVKGTPVKIKGWYEVTGPDRDIACIVDVHTSLDECLEEAVGHINHIYVIVPIEGKLYLTRGGVFSYYEFKYPSAHRLTDEAWQEMIKRGRAPKPPAWTSSFIVE